jgi:hypothetical protein
MKIVSAIACLFALLSNGYGQLDDTLGVELDSVLSSSQLYELHQPLIYNQPGYNERVKEYYAQKNGLYYKSAAVVLEKVDKNTDPKSNFRYQDGEKNVFVFYEKMETAPAIFRRYYVSFMLDSLPNQFEYRDEELIHLDFFATVIEGMLMSDIVRAEPKGCIKGKKTPLGYEIDMDVVAENGLEFKIISSFKQLENKSGKLIIPNKAKLIRDVDIHFWRTIIDIKVQNAALMQFYENGNKSFLLQYTPSDWSNNSYRLKRWYSDGNLFTDLSVFNHRNGERMFDVFERPLLIRDKDGEIIEKGKLDYDSSERTGKWKFYDKNGELIAWYKFKNGVEVKSSSTIPFDQFTHPDYHNYFSYFQDPYQIIRD